MNKRTLQLALAISVIVSTGAYGQTTGQTGDSTVTALSTQSSTMDKHATVNGQLFVADKTASSFITLAGSKENAVALVTGLRNGTAITLTSGSTTGTGTGTGGTAGGTTGSTGSTLGTTITPPTGKMGWGNVFISLALAQKILTQAGITEPTAAQLQTALMGGDLVGADGKTVTVKGVLQLRADGMGWGKIAQVYGTKLGPVVSEIKSANKQLAAGSGTGTTTTANSASNTTAKAAQTSGTKSLTTSTGITTAGGTAAGATGGKGLSTASGHVPNGKGAGIVTAGSAGGASNRQATGKGLVTGAGNSVNTAAGATRGNSSAAAANAGAGIVTATGTAATAASSGLTNAQGAAGNHGNGSTNGKGRNG